ncbi:MAG: GDP-L-fucose synthase [Actinomycetales bacterium]|nr:MAG: GDP-L-fucose synthase [Actinomycetales bacterium]
MRIYVAGINGLVGSAIALQAKIKGHEVLGKSSKELDLTDRPAVFRELTDINPDSLIIAAAKVGGIGANSSMPVDFLSINLQIQTNLLDAAHAAKITRVLFLGSSCIYPKLAPQPIPETALLTGELEQTNEPYAIAKIAGLKLVEAYRRQFGHQWVSAMPTNLYGPRDNFDLETAHVLPALLHRFHNAKVRGASEVEIWGDGTPLREFLHVEDLAQACLMLLNDYNNSVAINIGSGQEISIGGLAAMISKIVGFTGNTTFNTDRPNGTPRKLLDSTRIAGLGWKPQISLEEGLASTYDWFLANHTKEPMS